MIKLINILIDMKDHQIFIHLPIALLFILRLAHNSKCHHVI